MCSVLFPKLVQLVVLQSSSHTVTSGGLEDWRTRGGGGVLPYMGYTGTCRWIGYGFWPLCPEQGIYFQASLSRTHPRQGMVARLSSNIWQSEIRDVSLHLFK